MNVLILTNFCYSYQKCLKILEIITNYIDKMKKKNACTKIFYTVTKVENKNLSLLIKPIFSYVTEFCKKKKYPLQITNYRKIIKKCLYVFSLFEN